MGKTTTTARQYQKPRSARHFTALLNAWQRGEDVAWADLMAAWVKAPTAPVTREMIVKVINGLENGQTDANGHGQIDAD